jgi:hypothetical protein
MRTSEQLLAELSYLEAAKSVQIIDFKEVRKQGVTLVEYLENSEVD